MADLRFTDTNAADDSGGSVWGLDGNLFMPVVASAALSIGVLLILFAAFQVHWLISTVIGAVPFSLTLTYVLMLRQGKPPGYDADLFHLWVTGRGFSLEFREQTHFRRPGVTDSPSTSRI